MLAHYVQAHSLALCLILLLQAAHEGRRFGSDQLLQTVFSVDFFPPDLEDFDLAIDHKEQPVCLRLVLCEQGLSPLKLFPDHLVAHLLNTGRLDVLENSEVSEKLDYLLQFFLLLVAQDFQVRFAA